jgi:rare lipoprotein A
MNKKINAFLILCVAFLGLEVTRDRPEPVKSIPTIRIERPVEVPAKTYIILNEKAKASYYWQGPKTANGEKFFPDGISCAHRTLPFNTIVRVTNLNNGKSVECRINDRGPAKWTKKEIDLSRGAARELDYLKQGITDVKIEVVK